MFFWFYSHNYHCMPLNQLDVWTDPFLKEAYIGLRLRYFLRHLETCTIDPARSCLSCLSKDSPFRRWKRQAISMILSRHIGPGSWSRIFPTNWHKLTMRTHGRVSSPYNFGHYISMSIQLWVCQKLSELYLIIIQLMFC